MILNENLFEDIELTLDDKLKYIKEYPTYTTDHKTYFTRGCRYNELGLTPEQEDTFFKFLQDGELNNFWIENDELSDKIYQAGRMGGHLILDDEDVMPGDWEDFNTFDDVLEAERDEYRYYDTPLDDWEEKQARENAEEKVNLTYQKLIDFDNRVDQLIDNLKLELDGYVDPEELNSDANFPESRETLPESVVKSIEPLDPDVYRELENIMSSTDKSFPYMLLDRLRADCAYVLGPGNGNTKYLWFDGNIDKQIALMRGIYRELDEKPDWLSLEEIDTFEKKLKELKNLHGEINESIEKDTWYYTTIKRSEKQGNSSEKERIYSILVKAKTAEEARDIVDTGMILNDFSSYEIIDIHKASEDEINSDVGRVQVRLDEDIEDTSGDITELTTDEATVTEKSNAMLSTLNTLIKEELNAVQLYNDAVVQSQALGYDDFKKVFEDLISEETLHVGELQKLLDIIQPSTISDIEDGQEEAGDLLDDQPAEAKDETEEDPDEGQHY